MSKYDILQNEEGEIVILLGSYEGRPENPRFVYDGGETALFYRSRKNSIILTDIAKDARKPLMSVDEVIIAEADGDDITREYVVPVRLLKDIKTIL